jgi:prophage DNA circulation protein
MTGEESDEVIGIIKRIGPVVLSAAVNSVGSIGAALRRAVGLMISDASMTHLPTFVFAFGVCLDLARHSEATLVGIDRIRKAALAETPASLPAVLYVNSIVGMALATEARIVAFMQFRSREEVEDIATAMNAAFSQSAETAADELDQGTYLELISLHGSVVKLLADRGRLLPRIIHYDYQMVMPALRMAQRAYQNPARYQELIDENHIVHPAFMPSVGKMLAL